MRPQPTIGWFGAHARVTASPDLIWDEDAFRR